MFFYFLFPHIYPHTAGALEQTTVRLTEKFFGLIFGQIFVVRTHYLMQLPTTVSPFQVKPLNGEIETAIN